jgi:hypothetical protein
MFPKKNLQFLLAFASVKLIRKFIWNFLNYNSANGNYQYEDEAIDQDAFVQDEEA